MSTKLRVCCAKCCCVAPATSRRRLNVDLLENMVTMGFPRHSAINALKQTDNDITTAVQVPSDWSPPGHVSVSKRFDLEAFRPLSVFVSFLKGQSHCVEETRKRGIYRPNAYKTISRTQRDRSLRIIVYHFSVNFDHVSCHRCFRLSCGWFALRYTAFLS